MLARAGRRQVAAPRILTLLAVAEFMLVLDVSIVNVALPAIRADLGFSASGLQWVVNAYALTFGGFLLLGGRAADLAGGRRVFLSALAAFSASSLVCGVATSPAMLVVGRGIQGLTAGVLSPATLSILMSTYEEASERGRALSVWTAVAIAGGALGALLGGVLTEFASWRWIFLVNVPVGAALLFLAAGRLRRDDSPRRGLDVAGAVTVTAGLVCLAWGLIRSSDAGWGSAEVVGGLVGAAVLLASFATIEARLARAPLVPFSVFRSRLLSAGNLLSFLSFVPVVPTWYFLTLYLQAVRGYTPIQAGLVFIPMSLAVMAGSQVGFRALPQGDARRLFVMGGLVACAGLLWLGQLSESTNLLWVIVPGCMTMTGGGLMFAPVTVAATAEAAPHEGGLASGLLNTTRQLGGGLGLAVLGTIAVRHGHMTAHAADYSSALTVGACVFFVTAVTGAFVLPRVLRQHAPGASPEPLQGG